MHLSPPLVDCPGVSDVPVCVAHLWLAVASYVLLGLMLVLAVRHLLGQEPVRRPGGGMDGRAAHACLCLLIIGAYAIIIDEGGIGDGRLGCACGAWAVSLAIVVDDMRAYRPTGSGLKLWWVLAALVAVVSLPEAVYSAASGGASAFSVARIAASVLSILMGIVAFFQPSTPPGRFAGAATPNVAVGTSTSIGDALLPTAAVAAAARAAPAPPNGEASASFASRLFFSWSWPLLKLGASRPLEHSDTFELQPRDATAHHDSRLGAAWARQPLGRGVFLRAYHEAFGAWWWSTGVLQLLKDILTLLQPPLTKQIVDYLAANGRDRPYASALLCALGYFAVAVTQAVLQTQFNWRGRRLILWTQASVGQLVYRKALRLAHDERQTFGVGPIVSYMQVDSVKLANAAAFWLHDPWSCALIISVGTAQLYSYLGPSALVGVGSIVLALPAQRAIQRRLKKYNERGASRRARSRCCRGSNSYVPKAKPGAQQSFQRDSK